jgi:phospholipase C
MAALSRREFLRLAGATAALGPAGASAAIMPGPLSPASPLETFDYVVVLMLENRSFDNLLGYLYEPGAVPQDQPFEGVAGKFLANPIPPDAEQAQRQVVSVEKGHGMEAPNPDPGEEYPYVNTQLYGTVHPAANRYKPALATVAPYNAPDPVPVPAPMNGFVADYISNFHRTEGRAPTYAEYKRIMHCFPPGAVPVLTTLARQFAVCDHWHCEVPSQTFCNRPFFHAGSSAGLVLNAPYAHWVTDNQAETIFERLEAQGLSWKVYFDRADVFSLTGLIHYPRLRPYFSTHFCHMAQFYDDVRTGHLPHYAFIEPRFFVAHNDMHPPIRVLGKTLPSSVLGGELLISQIYDAIRLSDSPRGNNYQNTLLVITFDAHGGCYDHVPPPATTPPEASAPAGQMGLRFDRLGVRVPTVLVSAWIEPGLVITTPLQHTSLLKTLSARWGLGHLTARDRAAHDIREAFTTASPRAREDWPLLTPRPLPDAGQVARPGDHPLNALQRDIVRLANTLAGAPAGSLSDIGTVWEALKVMQQTMGTQSSCR